MLGIAAISDPKPLMHNDLFDAEYSSSEDETDKQQESNENDTWSLPKDGTKKDVNAPDNLEDKNQKDANSKIDNKRKEQDENVDEHVHEEKMRSDVEDEKAEIDRENGQTGSDGEDEKAGSDGEDEKAGSDGEDEKVGSDGEVKNVESEGEYEKGDSDKEDEKSASDDEEMAKPMPMERAKSKKQKANERQKLSRQVKQQAIEQIHSESQRIIRESKLSIPYHKPKPLSLNEFFSKKPKLDQIKAPKAVSRILQCNRKDTPMPATNRSKSSLYYRMRQTSGNMHEWTSNKLETKNSEIHSKEEVDVDIRDEDKLVLRLDSLSDDEDMDKNLPEVDFGKTTETNVNKEENVKDSQKHNIDGLTSHKIDIGDTDQCDKLPENSDKKEFPLQPESQDWSLRLDIQTLHDTLMPDSDSEIETVAENGPLSSKIKYESVPKGSVQNASMDIEQAISKYKDDCDNDISDVMFTPESKTLQISPSTSNKKHLLEKLKWNDTLVPKLGGNEDGVIRFDSNDEHSSTGVITLMERFVKHSTKKTIKRKSHVQLEVVKKEVNSEGKEELIHEVVPVTLGEDEQQDPKLETPGAKLQKLKENLQVKMKAQREVERQRRIQAYKMDNEEGYEEGENQEDELEFNNDKEEEAEITDGSETDGDYVPGQEEDDDDGEDEDEEKIKKNTFLDGEAIDEDEEELPSVEFNAKALVVDSMKDDSNDEFVFKSRKKKKKMIVDDDDDDDEDNDNKCDETHDSSKNESGFDLKLNQHDETSTFSSSSVKSLFKNKPMRYSTISDGKTMDLFDSSTNTTDPSVDAANSSVSDGLNSSTGAFSLTPIKEKKGLIRHKSTDFANTPDDSDDDLENKSESDHIKSAQPLGLSSSFEHCTAIPPYQQQISCESSSNIPSAQLSAKRQQRNDVVSKIGELTLPIEDSQDLFQQDFSYPQSLSSAEIGGDTQNLHLSFEESTQTQFLDENGFLKVKTSKSQPSLTTTEPNDDDGDMDELLGLCSGQFTATAQPSKPKKGAFSQLSKHGSGTQDMDELLQLCSGTFTGKNKHKETEDDLSESSFQILSDNESIKGKEAEDGFSDNEEKQKEDDDENEEEEELNEEDEIERPAHPKKFSKTNFIEEEAELSGSEFGSDEEYDAEEFGDLMVDQMLNEEVGDENEIHNKIQKMHMKLTDDEDARRLRLYKEAFLTDGDLHDGTKGRTRQFKWRNVDDDSWASGMNKNSDDEAEDDENENEIEWRKQRHEREQCLKDQDKETRTEDDDNDDDCIDLDGNSQFDKFIKKVSMNKRKKSTTTIPVVSKEPTTHKSPSKPTRPWFKHGSFLNRGKNDLDRISNMFKPLSNPNRPRNRNFVFQSLSSDKTEETKTTSSQIKRPLDKMTPNLPRNKKAKLSISQPKQAKSIFQHL
ncbi:claspin-like [Antedon mediterranea]|uniref:claspin-like n=1 Tax=Antedon mediterranea TaxID=105859 RepID=UPI003AF67B29